MRCPEYKVKYKVNSFNCPYCKRVIKKDEFTITTIGCSSYYYDDENTGNFKLIDDRYTPVIEDKYDINSLTCPKCLNYIDVKSEKLWTDFHLYGKNFCKEIGVHPFKDREEDLKKYIYDLGVFEYKIEGEIK